MEAAIGGVGRSSLRWRRLISTVFLQNCFGTILIQNQEAYQLYIYKTRLSRHQQEGNWDSTEKSVNLQ